MSGFNYFHYVLLVVIGRQFSHKCNLRYRSPLLTTLYLVAQLLALLCVSNHLRKNEANSKVAGFERHQSQVIPKSAGALFSLFP